LKYRKIHIIPTRTVTQQIVVRTAPPVCRRDGSGLCATAPLVRWTYPCEYDATTSGCVRCVPSCLSLAPASLYEVMAEFGVGRSRMVGRDRSTRDVSWLPRDRHAHDKILMGREGRREKHKRPECKTPGFDGEKRFESAEAHSRIEERKTTKGHL